MRQEAEFSIRLFGPAILLHPEGGRRRSKECKESVPAVKRRKAEGQSRLVREGVRKREEQ